MLIIAFTDDKFLFVWVRITGHYGRSWWNWNDLEKKSVCSLYAPFQLQSTPKRLSILSFHLNCAISRGQVIFASEWTLNKEKPLTSTCRSLPKISFAACSFRTPQRHVTVQRHTSSSWTYPLYEQPDTTPCFDDGTV
jgi:hypothetical protein